MAEVKGMVPDVEIKQVMEELKNERPLSPSDEKVHLNNEEVRAEEEETHKFDAKVDSLLSILINSVYSSKDYFLRELLANASDAIDKRRKKAAVEGNLIEEDLFIKLLPNKEEKTFTIVDKGIGMTKADLVNYLGSIANSGTKEFKQMLAQKEGSVSDSDLIGQFGLGFYSAFLIADQVDVVSQSEDGEQHIWSSRGPGGFVVAPHHGASIGQGTHVILHVADKCLEYLEQKKIEELVKAHSLFIEYPIYLPVEVEEEEEQPSKDVDAEADAEAEEKKDDASEEKEDEEMEVEEVKEDVPEEKKKVLVKKDKRLNSQKPLWARDPKDKKNPITHEEYAEFYKTLTNDWEEHFAVNHSHIDGDLQLQLLLYVPKRPPFNMFERNKKRDDIKLFLQNVLVTSDMSEAVPEWLSFVKGVIGSKDLPINVSREMLQGKNVMKLIKKVLIKKVIEMVKGIAEKPEEYEKFYKNFSGCLKLAVYQEKGDVSTKVAKFLRYETTKEKETSLDDYISRMKEGQKQIYVITGTRREDVVNSPFLEPFSDYEVIFMYESIDEFMIQNLNTYGSYTFQRINVEGVEIPGESSVDEELKTTFEPFVAKVKEILGNEVDKVVLSSKLKSSSCTVTSAKHSYSPAMEQIMRTQPGADKNPMLYGGFMTRKVFEINPLHPIIKDLKRKSEENDKSEEVSAKIHLIFETSMLECGYTLENIPRFTSKIFKNLLDSVEAETEAPVSCVGEQAAPAL